MRFLSKYELMEQLTLGVLETYTAHRIGGGERLLVHLFSLPVVSPTEVSNLELLQSLEQIAPLPPGPIVDAGRYDDGSQAFVVSKFPPDATSLQRWLGAYRAQAAKKESTAELQEFPPKSSSAVPASPAPPSPPHPAPGEFTRAFQIPGPPEPRSAIDATATTINALARDPLIPPAYPAPSSPEKPAATSFTQEFFTGTPAPERASSMFPEVKPTPAVPSSDVRLGDLPLGAPGKAVKTDLFAGLGEAPSAKPPAPAPEDTRPGEFTSFFSGPFTSKGGSRPLPPPEPPKPISGSGGGEFTALFGKKSGSSGSSSPATPATPLVEPSPHSSGSFSQVFNTPSARPPVQTPPVQAPRPRSNDDFGAGGFAPPPTPPPSVNSPVFANPILDLPSSPPPPRHPVPPMMPMSGPPAEPGSDGATKVFVPPASRMPQGPISGVEDASAYDRIVKGGGSAAPGAPPAGPSSTAPGAPAGGGMPSFAPPLPSLQPVAMPTPVMPQMGTYQPPAPPIPPAMGSFTPPVVPAPPPIPVPPAVALPPKPTAGWGAYTPAIIILALLLVAAIGLVLFFALRH